MIYAAVELEATRARAAEPEELRLALSMRGGVSLAVWIGGAAAEIERLRRAADQDLGAGVERIYHRLLTQAGYRSVTVDILSGASAGGLNGAIYAASLVYGFDFAEMAQLWLQLADIEALSHSTRAGSDERRESLLEGDGYFLAECCRGLERLIAEAPVDDGGARLNKRLDLFLSATLKDAVPRVLRNDRNVEIREARHNAFFHFRHLGRHGSALSDFPDPSEGHVIAAKLALAGRSSSSFPVAFEPATVVSRPGDTSAGRGRQPNMGGVFSEVTSERGVRVIDGGVLDNIPVGRAIQAIAAAPANGAAKRWLLYLHPSPTEPTESRARDTSSPDSGRGLAGVVADLKTAVRLKFNTESLVDDMVALEEHNASVGVRLHLREALLAGAAPADWDSAAATWARADGARIAEILVDADLAAATHPFNTHEFGPVLDQWDPVVRATFEDQIEVTLERRYLGARNGPLPLLALGDLLDTLLTLTQLVLGIDDVEARLYRVRLLVEVLHSLWDQSWAASAQHPPEVDEVDGWTMAQATDAANRSETIPTALVEALLDGLRGDGAADDNDFHRTLRVLYDTNGPGSGPAEQGQGLDVIWDLVRDDARRVAAAGEELDNPIVVALAADVMGASSSWPSMVLRTAPLHRRVLSGESAISFLRVSGDKVSPLAHWFAGEGNELTVADKLAGNQVLNFGAFFSARWRGNDWMWGRLDGSTSLVDLLCDAERWFPSGPHGEALTAAQIEADASQAVDMVKELVLTPFEGEPADRVSTWEYWRDATWEHACDAVTAELTAASNERQIAHPLAATRRVITERLHAEVIAAELPTVMATPKGAAPVPIDRVPPYESPAETKSQARALRAGTERLPADLEPRRWARIGMRLGLNAWLALRPPSTEHRFRLSPTRVLVAVFKPFYVFALSVLVFPKRAIVAAIVGVAGLALGRWSGDPAWPWSGALIERSTGNDVDYWTWQRGLCLVAIVALAVLLILFDRNKDDSTARRVAHLGVVGFGVLVVVLAMLQVWLAPVAVMAAAVSAVGIGFHWMASRARWAGVVVALGPQVALWAAVRGFDWFSPGWWALSAFAGSVTLTTVYVSLVDVFDPRPRATPASGMSSGSGFSG